MISEDSIKNDLKRIGIEKGDVLFITANIGATGFFTNLEMRPSLDGLKSLPMLLEMKVQSLLQLYTKTFLDSKKIKN